MVWFGFVRSAGLEYETILGLKGLPCQAIINFHDPYPLFLIPQELALLQKKT
jgi:hypothetical protein